MTVFAKIYAPVTDALSLGASLGYSDPDADSGDYPAYGLQAITGLGPCGARAIFGEITDSLSLHASAYS